MKSVRGTSKLFTHILSSYESRQNPADPDEPPLVIHSAIFLLLPNQRQHLQRLYLITHILLILLCFAGKISGLTTSSRIQLTQPRELLIFLYIFNKRIVGRLNTQPYDGTLLGVHINMAPTLYMTHGSPPVRAVLITAKAIGLELVQKEVNILHLDNFKPEFLQINPQHTIPTFVDDNGFTIWDSHAINIYLVSKYAADDALYPNDLKRRAIINQRLFFEASVVFTVLRRIVSKIILKNATSLEQEDIEAVLEAYGFLNNFLEGKEWVAGDFISIADYSLISSISTLNVLYPISEEFPRVRSWLTKCEALPEYEANRVGLRRFDKVFARRLSKL